MFRAKAPLTPLRAASAADNTSTRSLYSSSASLATVGEAIGQAIVELNWDKVKRLLTDITVANINGLILSSGADIMTTLLSMYVCNTRTNAVCHDGNDHVLKMIQYLISRGVNMDTHIHALVAAAALPVIECMYVHAQSPSHARTLHRTLLIRSTSGDHSPQVFKYLLSCGRRYGLDIAPECAFGREPYNNGKCLRRRMDREWQLLRYGLNMHQADDYVSYPHAGQLTLCLRQECAEDVVIFEKMLQAGARFTLPSMGNIDRPTKLKVHQLIVMYMLPSEAHTCPAVCKTETDHFKAYLCPKSTHNDHCHRVDSKVDRWVWTCPSLLQLAAAAVVRLEPDTSALKTRVPQELLDILEVSLPYQPKIVHPHWAEYVTTVSANM